MTNRTKQMLLGSIDYYNKLSVLEKSNGIDFVKNQLHSHETSIKSIGVGFENNVIQAANIFLRIYKIFII